MIKYNYHSSQADLSVGLVLGSVVFKMASSNLPVQLSST